VEAARAQPWQLRLRVGDDRVAGGDVGPGPGVDVQRQEAAHLRGRGFEVAIPGHLNQG